MSDTTTIMRRLEEIERELKERLDEQNRTSAEFRTKFYSILFGDAEDQEQKAGVFGRIAKLEQRAASEDATKNRAETRLLVLWGAVVTLAVAEIWNWIKK